MGEENPELGEAMLEFVEGKKNLSDEQRRRGLFSRNDVAEE